MHVSHTCTLERPVTLLFKLYNKKRVVVGGGGGGGGSVVYELQQQHRQWPTSWVKSNF